MSKLSDRLRVRARFETATSTSTEQDHIDWIAADALDALEGALRGAREWVENPVDDASLKQIDAILAKLEGK